MAARGKWSSIRRRPGQTKGSIGSVFKPSGEVRRWIVKLGAPLIGSFPFKDRVMIRDYVQAVEALGFTHLFADEILLSREYVYHETLTLFAYLAGVTEKIRFVTGIMVLPKRQTLLVAKQAAEVAFLSDGRLRLGVGVGWNKAEFDVLGIDYRARGKIMDEQIRILKTLWSGSHVDISGEYHQLADFTLQLPLQDRGIPIWIGGTADAVLRRAARLADGWIADEAVAGEIGQVISRLRSYLAEYGRDDGPFRFIKYLSAGRIPEKRWGSLIRDWQMMGITHVVFLPSGPWDELTGLDSLISLMGRFLQETENR